KADNGTPLPNASIRLMTANRIIPVGPGGAFQIDRPESSDTLLVTHVGYLPIQMEIGPLAIGPIEIRLKPDENLLQEVQVNTGYYTVPKERATGSFTHIDNK